MKIKWNKMRMWSDGALTKALKAGDMGAYEELFYRYYALIFRFVSRIVRNEALAEDVVQNIFVRLWLNRENLDENKSVKNFLYVSARNESFDILKSQKENMMSLRTVFGRRVRFFRCQYRGGLQFCGNAWDCSAWHFETSSAASAYFQDEPL